MFETTVVQVGLEFTMSQTGLYLKLILLSWPLEYWDYRCALPCLD